MSDFGRTYPDRAVARCSAAQAALLLPYDHHHVRVGGRLGVLLTYQWMSGEAMEDPAVLLVVFHYAERHPPAPPVIQQLVEELDFEPAT